MSPVIRSIHSQYALEARAQRHRIYMDPRWRGPGGCRARTLDRALSCCEHESCIETATIADHHPIPLAQVLRDGGDPFDDTNTRALCHKHSGHADGARS